VCSRAVESHHYHRLALRHECLQTSRSSAQRRRLKLGCAAGDRAHHREQPNLWFVFFDGEEAVRDLSEETGYGEQVLCRNLKGKNQIGQIKAMVLLDMIGDKNLNVTVNGSLIPQTFDASRAAGFVTTLPTGKRDTRRPRTLHARRNPGGCDLIDFEFGSSRG